MRQRESHDALPAPTVSYAYARRPDLGEVRDQSPIVLGDGLALLGATVEHQQEAQALVFTLYFQAKAAVDTNHSVSVRVTDRAAIVSGEDILAQQDAPHRVFGLYPTSRWRPGEVVRDIYVVPVPAGARPGHAEVLLYERLPSGSFRNLRPAFIDLPPL